VTVAKLRLPQQDIGGDDNLERMDATSMSPWRVRQLHGARQGARPSGRPSRGGATFTIPKQPVRRRVHGIETFNVVRGGEYTVMPSLSALIANLDIVLSTLNVPGVSGEHDRRRTPVAGRSQERRTRPRPSKSRLASTIFAWFSRAQSPSAPTGSRSDRPSLVSS
jgi:hypothetical protein